MPREANPFYPLQSITDLSTPRNSRFILVIFPFTHILRRCETIAKQNQLVSLVLFRMLVWIDVMHSFRII